jgi:ornithine cyclodeaminase
MLPQLSAEQVHAALPWTPLATALTDAFRAPPEAPTRHAHAMAALDHLLLMPAWNATAIGIKLVTVIPDAPSHGGHTVDATYLLLDRRTGAPTALLDGEALTVRRTAATSALAAQRLARPDARTLLIIGTGRLAPWMVRAHVALRPALRRVLVWGRDATRAQQLTAALGEEDIAAESVIDLAMAVHTADIVCCATTSRVPLVHGEWLAPGTHLDLVGAYTPAMREADDMAVARARIVVDSYDGALSEAGDLTQPLASHVIERPDILADLGEVLRGERAVRRTAADITLFKSVGHALEDLAAATLAMARHFPPLPPGTNP